MNSLSIAIFKVTAILLVTYGISSFIELVASLKMIPEVESIKAPSILYFSKLVPLVMGVIVWLLLPKLMSTDSSAVTPGEKTIVSTGCFLIGIFLVSTHLPSFIYLSFEYARIASLEYIGESMASNQFSNLIIIGSKFFIGLLLIAFSVKIGKLYALFAQKEQKQI